MKNVMKKLSLSRRQVKSFAVRNNRKLMLDRIEKLIIFLTCIMKLIDIVFNIVNRFLSSWK